MSNLELESVMEVMGIYNPLTNIVAPDDYDKKIHLWNNVIMYHEFDDTVVKGRIPLEVANIIYQKYPDNPYRIKIELDKNNLEPIYYAVDDEFLKDYYDVLEEKFVFEEFNTSEYKNSELYFPKLRLSKRPNDNKFITCYRIGTKEGLLILLTELKDYYLRKEKKQETAVSEYNELLVKLNDIMIEKAVPGYSEHSWMYKTEYQNLYLSTIEKNKENWQLSELRNLIGKFDKAVNPFLNSDVYRNEIKDYLKKVTFSAEINKTQEKILEGCCEFSIYENKTGYKTSYTRHPNGFIYDLYKCLDEGKYYHVRHYFGGNDTNKHSNGLGEHIQIEYSDEKTTRIDFNLTNGLMDTIDKTRIRANKEQIDKICSELIDAIKQAKEITNKEYIEDKQLKLTN